MPVWIFQSKNGLVISGVRVELIYANGFFFLEAFLIETFASIYSLSLYVFLATRCVLYYWFSIVLGMVVKLDDRLILGLP